MRSFKVGVKTRGDTEWVYNGLRFAGHREADAYAKDLLMRWTAVTDYIVTESNDKANANFPVPSDRYRTQRGPP